MLEERDSSAMFQEAEAVDDILVVKEHHQYKREPPLLA
jgi:hypothetical protein